MPLSQFKNVIGSVTTAAVLCYSYMGAPAINLVDFSNLNVLLMVTTEMKFDYYQLIDKEQAGAFWQIDVMQQLS